MVETMSETERVLRGELATTVDTLRTVVSQMPLPTEQETADAVLTVTGATQTLHTAETLVDALAELDDVTHETVLLVATARQSLSMMRSCLALLCAEVDSRLT